MADGIRKMQSGHLGFHRAALQKSEFALVGKINNSPAKTSCPAAEIPARGVNDRGFPIHAAASRRCLPGQSPFLPRNSFSQNPDGKWAENEIRLLEDGEKGGTSQSEHLRAAAVLSMSMVRPRIRHDIRTCGLRQPFLSMWRDPVFTVTLMAPDGIEIPFGAIVGDGSKVKVVRRFETRLAVRRDDDFASFVVTHKPVIQKRPQHQN